MIVFNPRETLSFFRTPGLGRSVLILLGLGFAALLAVAVASMMTAARTREFTDLAIHTQEVRLANAEIIKTASDAETAQRAYLLTAQPAYLPQYAEAAEALGPKLARLKWLVRDNPGQTARVERLRAAVDVRMKTLSRNLSLAQYGRRSEALDNIGSGVGHLQMLRVREISAVIDHEEAQLLSERAHMVDSTFMTGQLVSWLSLMLIVVVAGSSVWVIRRYVVALQGSRNELDRVNRQFARVEQIKKFFLLDTQLSAEDEELTPTMKLKRKLIESKYAAQIEAMYR